MHAKHRVRAHSPKGLCLELEPILGLRDSQSDLESDRLMDGVVAFIQIKFSYAETENLAVGDSVSSGDILVGGHLWRINCYPRGDTNEHKGEYVSIFLKLASKSTKVKAIFEAFVMGRDGELSLYHSKRCSQIYPPNTENNDWGWNKLVKRSDLESNYVSNGWVTIMCGVIVARDKPLEYPLHVPPSDIGFDLGCLLHCADGSDVSFVVDGETFPAHRAVLAARSPVFKAQLFGSMADATMPSITLHDITATTFKAMLRFMYTDDLPADDELRGSPSEMFQDLLALADRYALDRLKLICASKLCEKVSVDTVAAILGCAETYNCPELKKKCIAFCAEEKNFKMAVLTDGFVQLAQKFPSILVELREKVKA
ncbi:hypothetical protein ACP70R_016107 [Stipagrostis hirtigluma subsp. patula]